MPPAPSVSGESKPGTRKKIFYAVAVILAAAKSTKGNRFRYVVGAVAAALLVCPALILAGRAYLPKLWNDLHFVNFVVAWIPFVLGVLVAFVPDRELERRLRIGWRIVVILCGLIYSAVLWHEQALTDASSNKAQQELLAKAIGEANKHADEQFGRVHGEVQDVNKGLNQTKKDLVEVVQDTSSALGVTIGKVTQQQPPELASLSVSLYTRELNPDHPGMQSFISANDDGAYPVDFSVTNTSETTAKEAELWVQLCADCTFAAEPLQFDHPAGSDEQTRHLRLGSLNPGVSIKQSVLVKAPHTPMFQIAFRYVCETCGRKGFVNQVATLTHPYLGPPAPNKQAWKLSLPK